MGFEIRVFPLLGELPKAIEPHLPVCQLYRWQLGPSMWTSPTTKSFDPIVVTALRVGFPGESHGPATCEFACNCTDPDAWTTEESGHTRCILVENIYVYGCTVFIVRSRQSSHVKYFFLKFTFELTSTTYNDCYYDTCNVIIILQTLLTIMDNRISFEIRCIFQFWLHAVNDNQGCHEYTENAYIDIQTQAFT